jgi:hypothetical protein
VLNRRHFVCSTTKACQRTNYTTTERTNQTTTGVPTLELKYVNTLTKPQRSALTKPQRGSPASEGGDPRRPFPSSQINFELTVPAMSQRESGKDLSSLSHMSLRRRCTDSTFSVSLCLRSGSFCISAMALHRKFLLAQSFSQHRGLVSTEV